MTAPTTDLVSVSAKLARVPGQTIRGFLLALAGIEQPRQVATVLPAAIEVTEEQRAALGRFAELAGKIAWPDARRTLTEAEQVQLGVFLSDVKTIKKVVATAEASLRTALFNGLDVEAEAEGAVSESTLRDKSGHYLLEGVGVGWKRSVTAPSPSTDAEALAELDATGEIEHSDYLAATRQTRVVDEAGFLGLIARKPDLLSTLRKAVRYTRKGSVSLLADK